MGIFGRKKRVFLDYASMTPVDPGVLEVIKKYSNSEFANPSALYDEALKAKEVLKDARERIAVVLNCQKDEIIFTSGGTEGNNLSILGIFESYKTLNFTPHFITTVIEHSSILETMKEIERRGGEVTYIPVPAEGIVNPKDVHLAIKKNTVLVTIMYANNEIGTINDIKGIGKKVRDYRTKNYTHLPYFHTDACQAPLYLSTDVLRLGVDLLTLDGIKMYGPRGAGILYVKHGINLMPIIFGGGQERNLRSGTENVPNAAGLALALEIADSMKEKEGVRLTELRDYAIEMILRNFPQASLNGSQTERLPNNVNICFPNLDAEFAVINLDVNGLASSYSSSCMNLKEDSSSYVVGNLGKENCRNSSLRFSLGRETRKEDIDFLVTQLKKL